MRRICYFYWNWYWLLGMSNYLLEVFSFSKEKQTSRRCFFLLDMKTMNWWHWEEWYCDIVENDIVILWRMILWYFWEWYCDIMENCNKFSRTRRCTMPGIFLSIEQRSFPKRIYNLDIATQRHRMSWKHRETSWYQGKSYKQGCKRRVGTIV